MARRSRRSRARRTQTVITYEPRIVPVRRAIIPRRRPNPIIRRRATRALRQTYEVIRRAPSPFTTPAARRRAIARGVPVTRPRLRSRVIRRAPVRVPTVVRSPNPEQRRSRCNPRSEAQREATRRFIRLFGGRAGMAQERRANCR